MASVTRSKRTQIERVTAVFDDWARRGRGESMARSHGPTARQAFDALGLPDAPFRYLDVGCGTGYTVQWALEKMGPHRGDGLAVGLDGSAEMVSRAGSGMFLHARFPEHGRPDVLREASFDAIFSMEVFYYLPDLAAGLAEVRRLLRPGGRFACAVDYYAENSISHGWPADLGVDMNLLDAAGWRAAFEAAGLTLTDQRRLYVDDPKEPWKAVEGSLLTVGQR